ncbi:hypothetical protein [Pontibacter qinzhouensis]|nr:hypothetical protein [Pontibacter qinzhouensis]
MRNNTKVARITCYCKLNMLVPHLQRLTSGLQTDSKQQKAKSN